MAGILFALKSGKKLRSDIKEKGREILNDGKEIYADASTKAKEIIGEVKYQAKELKKEVRVGKNTHSSGNGRLRQEGTE